MRQTTMQVPGEIAVQSPPDAKDTRIAELEAQLAAAQAVASKPQVVFEIETPHGKLAKEASAVAHLTVDQLVAKIDAGEVIEPRTAQLCADGWYAPRRTS